MPNITNAGCAFISRLCTAALAEIRRIDSIDILLQKVYNIIEIIPERSEVYDNHHKRISGQF